MDHLDLYQKFAKHRLEGYDVEKWLNTPLKTCALRCKEADFTCRSFAHKYAFLFTLIFVRKISIAISYIRTFLGLVGTFVC